VNHASLLLTPLVGWVVLFAQARHYWGEGSYYAYGWAVPMLALALGLRRLREVKPLPTKNTSSRQALIILGALLVLLIPFRLVAEPDPYWRLPLWVQAATCIGITLTCLGLLFGRSSTRSFLFPCLFTLTALPWPTFAENALVHTLTGWVTAIDAEILLLSGQPAQVISNFVYVAGERIEIDATCSGIRSFQCLLAFGLFFGEYFRFSLTLRTLLAMAGLGFAFGFNLLRAVTLTFLALDGDPETYESWHDVVGYSAVGLAFVSLALLARFLSRSRNTTQTSSKKSPLRPVSQTIAWAAFCLALLPETITQLWFRYGVTEREVPEWTVQWDALEQESLTFVPFRKTTRDALLFDHGKRALMELDDGTKVEVFFYEYDGSRPAASVCSRHHNPSICMAATSANLVGGNESTEIQVGQATLRFAQYVAGSPSKEGLYFTHAFWCPWTPDTRSGTSHFEDVPRSERIAAFLSGRIDYARKVLLVVVYGQQPMETQKAEATFKELVGNLLHPVPN